MTLVSLSAAIAVLSTGLTAARDLVNPRWTVQRVCCSFSFFLLLIPPFVHFSHIYFHLPLNHQVLWLSTVFGLSIDAPKLSMDMASPCPSLSAFNIPSHSPLMRQPSISEASTPFHLNSSAAVRCSQSLWVCLCKLEIKLLRPVCDSFRLFADGEERAPLTSITSSSPCLWPPTTRVEKLQYKEILTPRSETQTVYPYLPHIIKNVFFNY